MAVVNQPDLPGEVEWPAPTCKWWEALPSTPGADKWTASDWQYLMTTALVHAAVWGNGDFTLLQELRNREEKYGITPIARKQVGAVHDEPEKKTGGKATPLDMIAQRRLELIEGGKGKKAKRKARA